MQEYLIMQPCLKRIDSTKLIHKTKQVEEIVNFDASIIELHNLARKLELNLLTKVVGTKTRALADELSELKQTSSSDF
jgi:hypothetical protein